MKIDMTSGTIASTTGSDEQYKVTILTDDNLFDGVGYIHSWLKFEAPGIGGNKQITTFSFSTPHLAGLTASLFGYQGKTMLDNQKAMIAYPYKVSKEFIVDKASFNTMLKQIGEIESNMPFYSLLPSKKLAPGGENCTTIINDILVAGGITEFQGLQTPTGIAKQINTGNGHNDFLELLGDTINLVFDTLGFNIKKWPGFVVDFIESFSPPPGQNNTIAPPKNSRTSRNALAIGSSANQTSKLPGSSINNYFSTTQTNRMAAVKTAENTLLLDTGISPDEVRLVTEGQGVRLTFAQEKEPVVLEQFTRDSPINKIQFANGTVWLPQDVVSHLEHDIALPTCLSISQDSVMQLMRQEINQFMAMGEFDEAEGISDTPQLLSPAQIIGS